MCFSAPASFILGSSIAVIGLAALAKNRKPPLLFLALIPCFFALQQFAEGIIWLYMFPTFQPLPISNAAVLVYLFFALGFWPVYLPFTAFVLEKVRTKKKLFALFVGAGAIVGAWNFYNISINSIKPEVIGQSLNYGEGSYFQRLIYGLVVFIPFILSSFKEMKILGLLGIVSFVIAHYIFDANFTSVWCFFAAIISAYIYKVVHEYSISQRS
jgi:hypothetical protein